MKLLHLGCKLQDDQKTMVVNRYLDFAEAVHQYRTDSVAKKHPAPCNARSAEEVDTRHSETLKADAQLSHVILNGPSAAAGDFSLSIGAFNIGMRTQRTSSDDKLIIGMLLAAEQRVAHWSFDMQLNDVLVIPPRLEHDGVFHGASAYAAMRRWVT